jgi:hypothetical protein
MRRFRVHRAVISRSCLAATALHKLILYRANRCATSGCTPENPYIADSPRRYGP